MAVTIIKSSEKPLVAYPFGAEAIPQLLGKEVLGGKGSNLMEMAGLGFPIPPGAILPCDTSVKYLGIKESLTKRVIFKKKMWEAVQGVLNSLSSHFGYQPLLSVRSGSRVSMPGMMDTILNVGLTSESLPFWVEKIGSRATFDSYRRLIQMYSSVALGVPLENFEEILESVKKSEGVLLDSELSALALTRVSGLYLKMLEDNKVVFPQTIKGQLMGAILAVFDSWKNPRAEEYRGIYGYPFEWGTAAVIQAMVFGNMNDQSATGVVFSRNPSTGENSLTGEFLINAQGEDVVAGIRTPMDINSMGSFEGAGEGWEAIYHDLGDLVKKLEDHYRDMQDVEFTVQDGELYILQTRNGKRSPKAAFRIVRDMVVEGVLSKPEALGRVTQSQLLAVVQDSIDPTFTIKPHLVGIAAGGGLVSGVAVFSSQEAINCNGPCVLVTKDTDPDDIAGMNASVGILTKNGGLTSHAAVVARGLNKACVVGATSLDIMEEMNQAFVGGGEEKHFTSGDLITIDGATGNVWVGIKVPLITGGVTHDVMEVLKWATGSKYSARLDLSTSMTLDEMLTLVTASHSESLYVDTAVFECGGDLVELMGMLGEALKGFKGSAITLDFNGIESYYQESDFMVRVMVGIEGEDRSAVKAICLQSWDKGVLEKVVVKVGEGFSTGCRDRLVELGVKISGKILTVADMLTTTGPIEVDDSVLEEVFGTKDAFLTVKELIEEKMGKPHFMTNLPPRYWYDAFSEVA